MKTNLLIIIGIFVLCALVGADQKQLKLVHELCDSEAGHMVSISGITPDLNEKNHGLSSRSALNEASGSKFVFSPSPPERPVVWMDYYHRELPDTKLGNHLVTGSYENQFGRYAWNDFSHTNTFDPLFQTLEKEFTLEIRQEPFTTKALSGTDIVLIMNPQPVGAPIISDAEIEVLRNFVASGGSLMVMLNSATTERLHETFEREKTGKLLYEFGLIWDEVCTHYVDIEIGDFHPYFYDMDYFHYGAGCTFQFLDHAQNPRVLLDVHEDVGQPVVRGPGISKVDYQEGKVIVVGDNGSWSGNMARPWVENPKFMQQLFHYAKRGQGVILDTYLPEKERNYSYTSVAVHRSGEENSLYDIEQPYSRKAQLSERVIMPIRETSADLNLVFLPGQTKGAGKARLALNDINNFEDPLDFDQKQEIEMQFSRLGAVGELDANGKFAQWVGTDVSYLFAFIPNQNIRVGDRWNKVQNLRIPTLQLADIPTSLPAEVEMVYLGDERLGGYSVRKFRSQASAWLPDLGITIDDILPDEVTRKWGGNPYRFFADRGGRLLYRAEQWVDKETGKVVKAKVQTRVLVWIEDTRKEIPVANTDKDGDMITITAHVVEIVIDDLD